MLSEKTMNWHKCEWCGCPFMQTETLKRFCSRSHANSWVGGLRRSWDKFSKPQKNVLLYLYSENDWVKGISEATACSQLLMDLIEYRSENKRLAFRLTERGRAFVHKTVHERKLYEHPEWDFILRTFVPVQGHSE